MRLAAALVERSRGKHGESFPGWGDVVIFAACTAARIGEVSGCRTGDIDRRSWTWTCGKIERLHQTLKRWLAAQPNQPATVADLQALLDRFRNHYNTHRPHRALGHRTPAAAYATRPKAIPTSSSTGTPDTRIRRDRIDTTGVVTLRYHGRLHHIGIGRTHARTHILLLVQDRHIRVVNAATGQLLRELTLDPARDYQPLGRPPTPPNTNPNPMRVRAMRMS